MSKYRLTPARKHVEELRMAKTQICKPVLVSRIQKTNFWPKIRSFFSYAIFKSIEHFCILPCTCSASVKLYINSSSSWLTAPESSCLARNRKLLQDENIFDLAKMQAVKPKNSKFCQIWFLKKKTNNRV